MKANRLIPIVAVVAAVSCAAAASASAATTDSQPAASANWSGYVASGTPAGTTSQFSSVSGSWVEPAADCSTGQGHASFWVGLGGAGQQSQALEQVGTEADCDGAGTANHSAWYELVPAAPVRLDLAISPGDHIFGNVSVNGTSVSISLSDRTTGASASKTLQMSNPDVASADWIAEAPSACDGSGACQPLSLANFGTVSFSNASATANGHTGTLSDANWITQPVQLNADAGAYGSAGPGLLSDQPSAGAAPSGLSADGSSFSVASLSNGSQPSEGYGYFSDSGNGGDYGY